MDNLGRSHYNPFWNKKNGRISEAFAEFRCATTDVNCLNARGVTRAFSSLLSLRAPSRRHTDKLCLALTKKKSVFPNPCSHVYTQREKPVGRGEWPEPRQGSPRVDAQQAVEDIQLHQVAGGRPAESPGCGRSGGGRAQRQARAKAAGAHSRRSATSCPISRRRPRPHRWLRRRRRPSCLRRSQQVFAHRLNFGSWGHGTENPE